MRQFRFLVVLIIIAIIGSLFPSLPRGLAQDGVQARVQVAGLNVRALPGTDAARVGSFPLDAMVTVTGREDILGNGGIWVYAALEGGATGWVLSDFLEFPSGFDVNSLSIIAAEGVAGAGGVPISSDALAGFTTNPVNFRAGPGTTHAIIRGLAAGTAFSAIARNGNNTWFKAVVGGQEGWLYYTLVEINGDVNGLPVDTSVVTTGTGGGLPPVAPAGYSAANLSVFSFGAHVQSLAHSELMRSMGMTWAKTQIRYSRGQDPNSVAGWINNAHNRGLRILLGVVGHPGDVTGGDAYFQDFANFVGGLAALGADAIEIWNEPNLDREWQNGQISPANYTRLLSFSYNAIKANNPSTIVISGALSPTGAEGAFGLEAVWNDNRFLAGMRDAGAARYMDCLGAHYNEGIVSPYWTTGDPRDNYYTRYFWGMVNTYRGIIAKPLCFTELGYLSPEGFGTLPGNFAWAGNTSVGQHAQWLAEAVRIARGSGSVKMVIIWNLDFQGSFGSDPMGGYAMLRPDGSCPACAVVR